MIERSQGKNTKNLVGAYQIRSDRINSAIPSPGHDHGPVFLSRSFCQSGDLGAVSGKQYFEHHTAVHKDFRQSPARLLFVANSRARVDDHLDGSDRRHSFVVYRSCPPSGEPESEVQALAWPANTTQRLNSRYSGRLLDFREAFT